MHIVHVEFKRDDTGKITHVDGDEVPSDYREPEFERFDKQAKHVHEWISYISRAMRLGWSNFSDEMKAVTAANAELIASNEQWE